MEKDKPVEIKYQVLQWGPGVVHLKISDNEFVKSGCKIDKRQNIFNKSDIILQLNLPDKEKYIP